MLVIPSKDEAIIKSILHHPIVARTALAPEERASLAAKGSSNVSLNPTDNFLLVYTDENELLGMVRYSKFSNLTLEFHAYSLPTFWGTGMPIDAMLAVIQHWKTYTNYKRIVTFVPASCRHVQKTLHKSGITPEGVILNSIIWNNKVQDMYIFGATI